MEKLTYRILMLEDTPSDAELVLMNLRRSELDFEHYHAEDRNSFLQGLRQFNPDIIISDYGLPSYTGLAAYADMRLKGLDVPFIMVTGSLPDEVAVDCLKAGIDDYILKDRLSRLPEAIHSVFNRKRLEREREILRELVKSRHNLETAEELARLGNWEWDVKSDEVVWSKNLYNVLGLHHETTQPSRAAFFERVHKEDLQLITDEMQNILDGKVKTASVKCRIVTPDGQTKMVQGVYSSNRHDNTARSIKVFGTMQDITIQFLTEKALRDLTEELEQRVQDRTSELSHANLMLERRNIEITDSINYAKLIQQALLSDLSTFSSSFPNSFVLWKPKDIVSGDFYWYHFDGDMANVAAIDCTGHGVPGALMSAIGHQVLNRIMHEGKFKEPQDILIELDNAIVNALRQENGHRMQDGMDLALVRLNRSDREVCFAGALRPLYLYSQGKVREMPGTRAAIGSSLVSRTHKQFTQECFHAEQGDFIYLTSDGYYSQFGGNRGRKMLKHQFTELLSSIGSLEPNQQQEALTTHLHQWQGEEDQVDDILIIGIGV